MKKFVAFLLVSQSAFVATAYASQNFANVPCNRNLNRVLQACRDNGGGYTNIQARGPYRSVQSACFYQCWGDAAPVYGLPIPSDNGSGWPDGAMGIPGPFYP